MSYVKINFLGGIISPGDLLEILNILDRLKIRQVRFGLRQQLLIPLEVDMVGDLVSILDQTEIRFEINEELYPNIVSSYPAEEVFIQDTWLSEGVYRDILDRIDYLPTLKINISDSNQSFTPLLTGNINWVASATEAHFWHLFIRFPKTNVIYEWTSIVYTQDVASFSKNLEELILADRESFYDQVEANGEQLMSRMELKDFVIRSAILPAQLPAFNLPYYEGLNRYNNRYWLGIYRRKELFSCDFLREACQLCLDTKVGQMGSTPWKTLMIKGIEEKDKGAWNLLLEKHQINMRHAANELNFQLEDHSPAGLDLKQFLVRQLSIEDTRSFGLSIGIKTRPKSEVFGGIVIRSRPILWGLFQVYDIMCAHDFNPNQRTGSLFCKGVPKFVLGEQLRRAILSFYKFRTSQVQQSLLPDIRIHENLKEDRYFCQNCLSRYDPAYGDIGKGITVGTFFEDLPSDYCCELCESPKSAFHLVGN